MHVQASGCLPWGSQDYDVENIRQYCILSPEGNVYHLIRQTSSFESLLCSSGKQYNRSSSPQLAQQSILSKDA